MGSSLCLLESNLASTWRPRTFQSRPRVPKSRPRQAKSCPRADQDAQERPGHAEDSPRRPKTAQEPAKSRPRCLGAAQDLPRTCSGSAQDLPEPLETPRITCDLKRNPSFITQSFRTSCQATKRPKSKTSGGGTPPKGVFNPPPNRGRRAEPVDPGLLVLPSPISLDQVPDSKVLGACLLSSPS